MAGSSLHLLHSVILAAASLSAATGSLAARRAAPPDGRRPWSCFAGAALASFAGYVAWGLEKLVSGLEPGFPSVPLCLLLLFHPLFAFGTAHLLQPSRNSSAAIESALDTGLVLIAALILLFAPLVAPFGGIAPARSVGLLALLLWQLGSLVSLSFAALLFVSREVALPGRVAAGLGGSAALLSVGDVLVAPGALSALQSPAWPPFLLWLGGWTLLAVSGFAAARAHHLPTLGTPDLLVARLRRAIVPGATLFLGGLAISVAIREKAGLGTAIAIGALSLLLAVRTGYALHAAERRLHERRQLTHTRAMVELSHALAGATELHRTLQLVAVWASQLLSARSAAIELLSEDGQTLELHAVVGQPAHLRGLRFSVDRSFTGWVVRHGRTRATRDAATDPYLDPQSLPFTGHTPLAAAPLRFRNRVLGALVVWQRGRPFDAEELELLGALADQAAIAIENARLFEQVRTLSLTDPLTGLANRRHLERDLAREFAAAQRGRKLVAVLFDMDGFKPFNDRCGHLAGDEALRTFGRILATETRAMNLAARYGGDEFAVLLADCTREGAEIFARRICERFAEEVASAGLGTLTVSAGVAEYTPDMQAPEDLIAAADRALYQAKAQVPRGSVPAPHD